MNKKAIYPKNRPNKKYRILFVGNCEFPEGGASGRAIYMQSKGLTHAGHQVEILVKQGSWKGSRKINMDGFVVKACSLKTDPSWCKILVKFQNILSLLKLSIYLSSYIIEKKFDWIIFYGVSPIFAFMAILSRIMRQKTALVQYDLMENKHFRSINDSIKRYIIVFSEVILVRFSNLQILGYSSMLLKRIKKINREHSNQCQTWPPTDTNYFSNGNGKIIRDNYGIGNRRVILYLGAISRLEGSHILLHSMKRILEMIPDAVLLMVGEIGTFDSAGSIPIDYKRMSSRLGIGSNVIFTGNVRKEKVLSFLHCADVLVLPKIEHPANDAASPIKIGEYLSSGKPVVASRVCELDSWLKHKQDVLFCEPGSPEQLAEQIIITLKNPKLAKRLGENGRKAAIKVCDYRQWTRRVEKAMTASE